MVLPMLTGSWEEKSYKTQDQPATKKTFTEGPWGLRSAYKHSTRVNSLVNIELTHLGV